MARSFKVIGAALTTTDADPNVTPPDPARILDRAVPSDPQAGTGVAVGVAFVAGTTPDIDGTIWVRDKSTGRWFAAATFATLTSGPLVIETIPRGFEVFVQVTAVNGAPTSFTLFGAEG